MADDEEEEESCRFLPSVSSGHGSTPTPASTLTINSPSHVQVVEELLSRSGALGKETAKGIADAAMLEVASISVGHMVRELQKRTVNVNKSLPSYQ